MYEQSFSRGWPQSILFYISSWMRKADGLKSILESRMPLVIEDASAQLSGSGSIIVVYYRTNRPMTEISRKAAPYLIDQESGRRLEVQRVPYIGSLSSRSAGPCKNKVGYMVVDNSDSIVGLGSRVKLVIGSLEKENVIIT